MKKLLGGGLALAFTAAGTFLLAGPGGAQEDVLDATLSSSNVNAGDTVTISGDACPGETEWGIFLETDPEGSPAFDGGTIDATGGLNLNVTAPSQAGVYVVQVTCDGEPYEVAGGSGSIDFVFEVAAAPATTTTEAPPATPVTGRPDFTG